MWIYLLILAISLIYVWFKQKFSYWEKLGFPSVPGKIPTGSMSQVNISEHSADFYHREYKKFKHQGPAFGVYSYNRKILVPTDLDLIEEILVKNAENFNDRGFDLNDSTDPLVMNVYTTKGEKWKELRSKVEPSFSFKNTKMMFPIVSMTSSRLVDQLKPFMDKNQDIDFKEIFQAFCVEVIANIAFGFDTKCVGNPKNEFYQMSKGSPQPSFIEIFKMFLLMCSESLAKYLNLRFMPAETSYFFLNSLRNSVELRENNQIIRHDFFQLMVNKIKDPAVKLSFKEMAANCYMFLSSGLDTTYLTLTFLAYELTLNTEIQNRLRDEIDKVLEKFEDEISLTSIADMKYLDMVLNETLRKWPINNVQFRKSSNEFQIPKSNLKIPAETFITIPVYSIHRDERFYENPDKFLPERFSEEAIRKRPKMAFLPFSEGPRKCLGVNFATMQIKVCIVKLLRNFSLQPCDQTIHSIKFDAKSVPLSPEGSVWLKFEKLNNNRQ